MKKVAVQRLNRHDVAALQHLKDYMLAHLHTSITLSVVRAQTTLSEYKIKGGFVQLFGATIADFLFQARMEKAKELLLQNEKPLKEIAGLVGYKNSKSFHRSFRKYFGQTPGSMLRQSY